MNLKIKQKNFKDIAYKRTRNDWQRAAIIVIFLLLQATAQSYPEKTNVTNTQNFPFKGDIFTGFVPVNNQTLSNIFYTLYGFNNGSIIQPAPLIIWLDGGPGCASVSGTFSMFGPFGVTSRLTNFTLYPRNLTWNTLGHILTVDQPIGTGFSNAFQGEVVKTTEQATAHFQAFIARFYQLFPNFLDNDLYIVGESYAGHYIPAFAHQILSNRSNSYIKLKGVVLGAPWTDASQQVLANSEYFYAAGLVNQKERDYLKTIEFTAVQAIYSGDYEYATNLFDFQRKYMWGITGVDHFNYRDYPGEVAVDDGSVSWLNLTQTQTLLGIPVKMNYIDCTKTVYNNMHADIAVSVSDRLPLLLENIKVLAYAGQDDNDVEPAGIANFLKFVEWDGMRNIEVMPKKTWTMDGEVVGLFKTHLNYTYVTILKSGHIASYDQPGPNYDLLNRFINNIPFD